MPELPEVETIVRQLATVLPNLRIEEVEVLRPDLLREPEGEFAEALTGSRVLAVRRRGKNVVLSLSPAQILVVNLGMTGRLLVSPAGEASPDPTHQGVRFGLNPRGVLYYTDVRRFGHLIRYSPSEWARESVRLGPEPLDGNLTPDRFHENLLRSRAPLRSWLIDQTKIAGIGNIYACEALFLAGLHPRRQADSLSGTEAKHLLREIRTVLREAVKARGTTLRDYRTATGEAGGYGPAMRIYGRENLPCLRCNTLVERIVFGNRSAFLCPSCQPEESPSEPSSPAC
jgi:formamidopyrimidine-DNA glycosylase